MDKLIVWIFDRFHKPLAQSAKALKWERTADLLEIALVRGFLDKFDVFENTFKSKGNLYERGYTQFMCSAIDLMEHHGLCTMAEREEAKEQVMASIYHRGTLRSYLQFHQVDLTERAYYASIVADPFIRQIEHSNFYWRLIRRLRADAKLEHIKAMEDDFYSRLEKLRRM